MDNLPFPGAFWSRKEGRFPKTGLLAPSPAPAGYLELINKQANRLKPAWILRSALSIQEKSMDNYGRLGLVCDPGQGGGPPSVSPARITSALRRRI